MYNRLGLPPPPPFFCKNYIGIEIWDSSYYVGLATLFLSVYEISFKKKYEKMLGCSKSLQSSKGLYHLIISEC